MVKPGYRPKQLWPWNQCSKHYTIPPSKHPWDLYFSKFCLLIHAWETMSLNLPSHMILGTKPWLLSQTYCTSTLVNTYLLRSLWDKIFWLFSAGLIILSSNFELSYLLVVCRASTYLCTSVSSSG